MALVRVERLQIVRRETSLLRPAVDQFRFSNVHGITWESVCAAPLFREVWPALESVLEGAEFLAAHNAGFDGRVLHACCRAAELKPPGLPFVCSMRLARKIWKIDPATLPEVCKSLGLPLNHHDPGSDAEACAGIIMKALQQGAVHRNRLPNSLPI